MNFNKDDINKLSNLAKLNLTAEEEIRLLKDIQSIFEYFDKLQEVDTTHISKIMGHININNITAEDIINNELILKGIESFPQTEKKYLKIPGIMQNKNE